MNARLTWMILLLLAGFQGHVPSLGDVPDKDYRGSLPEIISDPGSTEFQEVETTAIELLALEATRKESVLHWLRRGGRLLVAGEEVDQALKAFAPAGHVAGSSRSPVGLGEIVAVRNGASCRRSVNPGNPERMLKAAIRLADTNLPESSSLHRATALRLAVYVGVLVFVSWAMRGFSRRWRTLGVICLVLSVGLWPVWRSLMHSGGDYWSQVDVIVSAGSGADLVYSAATCRSVSRGSITIDTGSSTWKMDHLSGDGAGNNLEKIRGAGIELVWYADDPADRHLGFEYVDGPAAVSGIVRNGHARNLTDVWLILPGRIPLHLDDIPANGAILFDRSEPDPTVDRTIASVIIEGLPLERGRLLGETLECLVLPLLSRDLPVVVAWADRPLRPACAPGQHEFVQGTTLVVSAGRLAS